MSFESSVSWIDPPEPESCKFKDPANSCSLYLDLSKLIAQKLFAVSILVLDPKVKFLFSSSNINDLYCPNIVWDGDLDGRMGPYVFYNRVLSAGEVLTNYNRLKGRFGL